ncbi:hypothetical protein Tco_0540717, partial [Tanacetum coccineum]
MNPQKNSASYCRDEKWVPSTERVKISPTNVRLETTMHQKEESFQVIIDKVKDSKSYEFILANKKCIVDAEVFRKIIDICPRVEGEEFTEVQDDDATLTFIIDLCYKVSLQKYTSVYVDHIHHPWSTLVAIINKYLSKKTGSNDRLRKSRIDILQGMFYKEYVNYPKLIWEDFSFQIDHRKEKKSRRETMSFPRFTKFIINYFLSQHKSLSKLKFQHYHIIKDDEGIKQSESYQMFIKYSTSQIPPKKSRGKGSQGKKTTNTPVADVDVSEESDSELARKRTTSRRVIKKKVTIFAVDNIIPDLNVALELGKSISLTKAAKEEVARQVHATHARIMTGSVLKPARRRPLDTMQDLKESRKTIKRQPCIGGSSEGTGRISGVLDESTVVSTTSSEGTGTILGVPDKEK